MKNREGSLSVTDRKSEIDKPSPLSSPAYAKEMIAVADRIAGKIARHVPPWVSKEDLIAAGRLGLAQAGVKYEPSQGPFLAYAEIKIRGAVLDEMRKGDIVSQRERIKIKKEKKAGLRDDDGPRALSLDYAYRVMKNAATRNADMGSYEGLVSSATQEKEVNIAEIRRIVEIVRAAVAKISEPRLRDIYKMYYEDQLTCEEIGVNLRISKARVAQLLINIKKYIKYVLPKNLDLLV